MPLRVLILGANGFIGSSLTRAILEEKDWEVYGMDMNSDRITDLLDNKSYKSRMHFFEGDITINKEWVEYHVKKCDVILPLDWRILAGMEAANGFLTFGLLTALLGGQIEMAYVLLPGPSTGCGQRAQRAIGRTP